MSNFIKYIGSKRLLIDQIVSLIKKEKAEKVLDLFSGTSRVGYALQNEGIKVIANDISTYAYFLGVTHVQANKNKYINIQNIINELNNVEPNNGWFTEKYSYKARFFQPKNGSKIEGIRNYIEQKYGPKSQYYNKELYQILIVSLIAAADKIDSTCGVQMAYLKQWSKRSHKDIELNSPLLSKGNGSSIQEDAKKAASIESDLVYIDSPYNQHNYLGNYHIWETVCLWDEPETYGKAQKRVDVKTRKSNFNSKKKIFDEFKSVIDNLSAPKALVSFNNEGYLSQEQISDILKSKFNTVEVLELPYKRYVGAKIGIHNKKGEKVGEVTHTENKELLFLAK